MAETLIIQGETMDSTSSPTKCEKYETLYGQLESLVQHESDIIANMANISACIKDTFGFWWESLQQIRKD